MSTEHDTRARGILSKVIYATLATATPDGAPWNSPVRFHRDPVGNLYWFSARDAQHSRNIAANPRVFIVVFDSTIGEGDGVGVYIEATATECTDPADVAAALAAQSGAWILDEAQVSGDAPNRFYRATPVQTWINDEETDGDGNYVRDIRVAVSLAD